MTISGYSNAIVDLMLGWLKGLANWVLRLFNLAGSVSTSPLLWLSQNWLKLLIFFLALGIVIDRLIWLIRWRPYWVWFRKERVIVNDDRFFSNADIDKAADWEGDLQDNWDEHDYVVASTVVRRQTAAEPRNGARPVRRAEGSRTAQSGRRRSTGARIARRGEPARRQPAVSADAPSGADAHRSSAKAPNPENIFEVDLKKQDVTDSYEDEVFNVSNLPVFDEFGSEQKTTERNSGRK